MKTRFNTLLFFFALAFIARANVSNKDFFLEHYQIINQNIEQERYEANLALIGKLVQQQAYQELGCYHKGKILHKIGVSYYMLLQDSEAIKYYKDVVFNLWDDCPQVPPSEQANTIYNMGVSYQYLNEMELAKQFMDEALYIFENDAEYSRLDLADIYYGIGKFYHDINDSFRAELYYQNAINLYQDFDDTEAWRFEVLNELITMNMNFKDYLKTKKYIKEALSIYTSFPTTIDQLNLAWVYLNAGTTYFELEEYKAARQMAKKAKRMLDEEKEPLYYSIALEIMAMIQMEQQEYTLAEENMYRVLNIRKTLYLKGESRHEMTRAYENLCDVLIKKGDVARANRYLDQAFVMLLPRDSFDTNYLPIIRKSKALDDEQLMRLIDLKAKIFEAKYQDSGDVAFLKKALNTQHKIDSVINRGLVSFQFEQSKLDFLNLKFDHYGKAVEDALQLYQITEDPFYLKEAYHFSSKTKAIVLQYELNQTDAFHSNVPKGIVLQEKALRQKMHALHAEFLESSSEKDSILQAYTKAQNRLDSYLREIEKKQPTYFKEKYAFIRPPNLNEIQEALPHDMAVIEYFMAKDTIYSFWITRDQFFPVAIANDLEIKNAVQLFTDQCNNPAKEVSQKFSLLIYQKYLEKGLKLVSKKIKRLCIIPDGQLHNLPFEALTPTSEGVEKYLIEDYAISYNYSIALLFRENHKKNLSKYVGFGTSYSAELNEKLKAQKRFFGDQNLEQLNLSQQEIYRGASIFDGETYVNHKASLSNFLKYSTDADIIHLSLHGLVDTDDPNRSAILFDDNHKDFILSPLDLYSQGLSADLVLLSACHSASGKIYNGEGVQGMSKSFLLGGAHNILSSLWNASETSSMKITTSFLEKVYAGQSIDLALHTAKLDYLSNIEPNKKHPYYWANFILLAEVEKQEYESSSLGWFAAVVFIIIFLYALSNLYPQK